jgi:hypothetical protein
LNAQRPAKIEQLRIGWLLSPRFAPWRIPAQRQQKRNVEAARIATRLRVICPLSEFIAVDPPATFAWLAAGRGHANQYAPAIVSHRAATITAVAAPRWRVPGLGMPAGTKATRT